MIYHTHTNTHTHTQLSDKDNEEIDARGLKIVFEQVFYEESFKPVCMSHCL